MASPADLLNLGLKPIETKLDIVKHMRPRNADMSPTSLGRLLQPATKLTWRKHNFFFFFDSLVCFGPSMAFLGVRGALEMIVSHRAPSCLNMISYRAIGIHFRSNCMIFINSIFKNHISELQISGHLSPQPSGRQKT